MLTLTFLKAFFSHWLGMAVAAIILILLVVIGVQHFQNKSLEAKFEAQTEKVGSLSAGVAQETTAASDCSAGAAAVITASSEASANATIAVSETTVAVQPRVDYAKKLLTQKPQDSDDYKASVALMNQLIDHRQAVLAGTH